MNDTPAPFAERFIPGRVLAGRYRVVELAGRGGMGEVYRAHDLKLGQTVALKFLPAEIGRDPDRLEELFGEVRLARQISHPNVCRVYDVEDMEGLQFLSMEFVDGEDLASLLRRIGRLPQGKAVELAREICAGLQAIHERGVRHRDLKPANVMIDGRGHARITDFGLASAQGAGGDSGILVGTPAYLAPECFDGGDSSTIARDVYSLGLVLYELFTGHRPFEAATLMEWVHAHREVAPASPSTHVHDLDPRIERTILRCIYKRPERRPASAAEAASLLPSPDPVAAALAAGETPSPEAVAAIAAAGEGLRPVTAWTCLVALLAALTLITVLAPRTRLVSMQTLPDPPEALAARARDVLREAGVAVPATDRVYGFAFDEAGVERVLDTPIRPRNWETAVERDPTIVSFWYRESPTDLRPSPPEFRVSPTDPPVVPGMAEVVLDARGRLTRLEAPVPDATAPGWSSAARPAVTTPSASGFRPSRFGGTPSSVLAASAASDTGLAPTGVEALFRAAGLYPADFAGSDGSIVDGRVSLAGRDRVEGRPVRVDLAVHRGRPTSFVVSRAEGAPAGDGADPTSRFIQWVRHGWRPVLVLVALFLGAWLARRNLRAGRSDTTRALRVAFVLMGARVASWALGGHVTATGFTGQLSSTIAWGLYDFAFGLLSYVAIEPYVRRLWPRVLTSWMRILDGRHRDARVGRDLLIGCLVGVGIAFLVSAHQVAPLLIQAAPGRPDAVGFIEPQLASLLGIRYQLSEMLMLLRSGFVLVLEFVLLLVATRLTLRHAGLAMSVAFAIFVPLALPRGEFPVLNVALAVAATLMLLIAMLRFGLLAASVGLMTYTALQAAPLGLALGSWTTSRTVLVLGLVLAVGIYGFYRSMAGRPLVRDVLAEG